MQGKRAAAATAAHAAAGLGRAGCIYAAGRAGESIAERTRPGAPIGADPAHRPAACCRCPWSLASLISFSLSIAYLMLSLRWMTRERWGPLGWAGGHGEAAKCDACTAQPTLPPCPPAADTVLDLFCALNPALRRRQLDTFCWPKLWLGFYLNNAGERGASPMQPHRKHNAVSLLHTASLGHAWPKAAEVCLLLLLPLDWPFCHQLLLCPHPPHPPPSLPPSPGCQKYALGTTAPTAASVARCIPAAPLSVVPSSWHWHHHLACHLAV